MVSKDKPADPPAEPEAPSYSKSGPKDSEHDRIKAGRSYEKGDDPHDPVNPTEADKAFDPGVGSPPGVDDSTPVADPDYAVAITDPDNPATPTGLHQSSEPRQEDSDVEAPPNLA
jgi:hypothetical protein